MVPIDKRMGLRDVASRTLLGILAGVDSPGDHSREILFG
jgi:hypothetical protein